MIITKDTKKPALIRNAECKACGNCCRHGAGIVLPNEIPRLANHMRMSKQKFIDKYLVETDLFHTNVHKFKQEKNSDLPSGSCVFFSNGKCKIHLVKPLFCKITTCASHGDEAVIWYYLNYLVNPDDPQSIREWAQHLTVGRNIPGGELKDLVPDRSKLKNMLDYKI
ncbi:YkgJ family cysteine cluster protein [Candidatus Woesearchaeota archaeon]|nr:YkgJ family cysteine cluster protein [Candidatus Woesearchaeota archaeon]